MISDVSRRSAGPLVGGVLLVAVGVLFTLDNFGVLRAGDVFDYWPLVLVGVGLARIFGGSPRQRLGGSIVALAGCLMLLRTLHLLWFRLHDLWPFFLVLAGGLLVWQAMRPRPASGGAGGDVGARAMDGLRAGLEASEPWRDRDPQESGSVLHEFAFMGGGDRVVRSQEFRGGKVDAILGGFKIDLRGAAIAGESASIDVFAFWGGVDFRVPQEWNVVVHGMPILGAFVNRTEPGIGVAPGKTLIIRGSVVMGGVEVKN